MLKNKKKAAQRDAIISSISGSLIVRHGEWKLICQTEESIKVQISKNKEEKDAYHKRRKEDKNYMTPLDKPWEQSITLFNIVEDLKEDKNVAATNPAVVKQLTQYAIDAIQKGRSNLGVPIKQNKPLKYAQLPYLKSILEKVETSLANK